MIAAGLYIFAAFFWLSHSPLLRWSLNFARAICRVERVFRGARAEFGISAIVARFRPHQLIIDLAQGLPDLALKVTQSVSQKHFKVAHRGLASLPEGMDQAGIVPQGFPVVKVAGHELRRVLPEARALHAVAAHQGHEGDEHLQRVQLGRLVDHEQGGTLRRTAATAQKLHLCAEPCRNGRAWLRSMCGGRTR